MAETVIERDPEVKGLSPKAYFPSLVGLATGLILLVLGATVLNDATLEQVGLGVALAALGHFGIAYAAPVGDVRVPRPKPRVVEKVVEVPARQSEFAPPPAPAPAKPAARKSPPAKKPTVAKKPAARKPPQKK